MHSQTHILVTGANSGLGLEAARQLATTTDSQVWIGARSAEKAAAARDTLVAETGVSAERFGAAVFDLLHPDTVRAALDTLQAEGVVLDGVILNAGGMTPPEGSRLPMAPDGTTQMFAMNVGGHAHLVQGLLDRDLLREAATVVFAGSEASRGIPMMRAAASSLPEGDLDDVLLRVSRGEHLGDRIDAMHEYGLVKLLGTAWMQELAHRHGDRLRALSISPGMTTGTGAAAGMPGPMRVMMTWVMMPMMEWFGRAHAVDKGAARYLQGLSDHALVNGGFYASAYPGLTGPVVRQSTEQQPLLEDDELARATGRLLDRLTGSNRPSLSAVG